MLKLLIWLLHGTQKLNEFNDSIWEDLDIRYRYASYYVVEETNGQGKVAKVHPLVGN